MGKKITSKGKASPASPNHFFNEKYVKIRIDNVDNYVNIAPHFYNQRLLNRFKTLLKTNNIEYIYHKQWNMLIIDSVHLVITASGDGRFVAYNKMMRFAFSQKASISFSFEACTNAQIIHKLLRFNLINGRIASKFVSFNESAAKKRRVRVT